WLPDKLERQLPLFESPARPAVVFSERVQIDAEGRPLVSPQPPFPRGRVLGEMFLDNFVCFSSVVVRRDVFESVGVFDESWALVQRPLQYDAWHGLLSVPLPEQVRRWLRRALGRPLDWNVRQPVPS